MKIALCISGQPRGLENNIPNTLRGLIDPSKISDIFVHAWFDESFVGKQFQSAQPGQNGNLGVWHKDTVLLLESLSPKKMLIEKPRDFNEFSHLENLPSAIQTHLASNIYSVYTANRLKCEYEQEQGFEYDIVIRTRIDCNYHKPHNILNFFNPDLENCIHVPHMYQYSRMNDYYPTKNGNSYLALSDTFAYGKSNTVNKFCSIYPEFEFIHNNIKPYQYGECYFGYQSFYKHKLNVSLQNIEYVLSRN